MRTLFNITLNEETDDITTSVELTTMDDLKIVCEVIANIADNNKTFGHQLAISMLSHIKERMLMLKDETEDENIPDFDKILKNAKIDPNNHIKE